MLYRPTCDSCGGLTVRVCVMQWTCMQAQEDATPAYDQAHYSTLLPSSITSDISHVRDALHAHGKCAPPPVKYPLNTPHRWQQRPPQSLLLAAPPSACAGANTRWCHSTAPVQERHQPSSQRIYVANGWTSATPRHDRVPVQSMAHLSSPWRICHPPCGPDHTTLHSSPAQGRDSMHSSVTAGQ